MIIESERLKLRKKTERDLGPEILGWLADLNVIDIMNNPDGSVWLDTLSGGMTATELRMEPVRTELIIGDVAAYYGQVCNLSSPRLRAVLPLGGQRFQGAQAPVSAPFFTIRKHLTRVFTMAEQVQQGTLAQWQSDCILRTIASRQNVAFVGETLSGKTVMLDSVLQSFPSIFGPNVRIVTIEDTRELIVDVPNKVSQEASETATMRQLLQDTMRHNPGHIVVGEVRGPEAIEMLKAWASGHGGSACSLHAGSAEEALLRLETMVEEGGMVAQPRRIAQVVNLIVVMHRRASNKWRVGEMVRVKGWKEGEYQLERVKESLL